MSKGISVLNNQSQNIVWLKRDLRSQDHQPLYKAEQSGLPYRIIYLFEPSLIAYPDVSPRHLQFVYHSILSLNKTLFPFNRKVELYYGEAVDVFQYLSTECKVNKIYSYQESGTQVTWNRDKEVASFCRQKSILWEEFQRDGIIRGIKNRKSWKKSWANAIHKKVILNQY